MGDITTAAATTSSTLLRRYTILPGHWEPFLEVWRRIVVLRRRHGFSVLFALVDEEGGTFTWAVQHAGDIDAAAAGYYADPDRIALEHVQDHVSHWEVTTVVPLVLAEEERV